ncbi:histidine kinase [Actinomyces sp. ZJ308]|uniref:sensor histidine kinase n=1 Tax=Actinomyces sp. ZJ308 TaxID=2708342 RepID=UPI00141F2AD5|nr:histidine kinase [Actinomyces sp. ZJ308]
MEHRPESSSSPGEVRAPWPRQWLERHRSAVDLVVLALLLGYNQLVLPVTAASTAHLWLLEAVSAGLGLCWLLRRRRPEAAFAVAVLLAGSQLLAGPGSSVLPVDVLLALLVHHLAAVRRWRVSLPCAALIIAWIVAAFIPIVRMGYSRLSLPALCVVAVLWAWTAGVLQQTRREHLAALAHNAEYRLHEAELRHERAERQERSRIAREIHDIVSHGLGVMVVVSDGAAATAPSDPDRAAAAMRRVRDTGREALGDMRRMLSVLRGEDDPPRDPQPGEQDLEGLVTEARVTGLPVHLEMPDALNLPAGLGLTVYRIVQEGLANVRRHAGTVSSVEVRVHAEPSGVVVEVHDDGGGLSAAGTAPPVPGHGLTGMRERVASHGGVLHAGPRSDGGFALRAVLPWGGQPEEEPSKPLESAAPTEEDV